MSFSHRPPTTDFTDPASYKSKSSGWLNRFMTIHPGSVELFQQNTAQWSLPEIKTEEPAAVTALTDEAKRTGDECRMGVVEMMSVQPPLKETLTSETLHWIMLSKWRETGAVSSSARFLANILILHFDFSS